MDQYNASGQGMATSLALLRQDIISLTTDLQVTAKMKKQKYLKIAILAILFILLTASVSAICLVRGYVFNPDGTAVLEGTPVKIRIEGSPIENVVNTGGHVTNFYYLSIYSCMTGQDSAIVETEVGNYKASAYSPLDSPYYDINLTLTEREDYTPVIISETKVVEKEATIGRLTRIKAGSATTISPFDTVLYELKGVDRKFELGVVQYPFAGGTFPHFGSSIGLSVGSTQQYDLDANGAEDTEVTLVSIEANKATFIFRSILEVMPVIEELPLEIEEESPAFAPMAAEDKVRYLNSLLMFIAVVLVGWLVVNIFMLIKEKFIKRK
jgi:hypothetical protein